MSINPKSLENLIPGGNSKNAIRVSLTLKPKTVALLRAQGNMSAAVDKLIELCCLGLVEHDGCLNPKQPSAKEVHNSIVAIAPVDLTPKPEYWAQALTRSDMLKRGFSAYRLDKMAYGDTITSPDYGDIWYKTQITTYNTHLRPLGSKAKTVWCR